MLKKIIEAFKYSKDRNEEKEVIRRNKGWIIENSINDDYRRNRKFMNTNC